MTSSKDVHDYINLAWTLKFHPLKTLVRRSYVWCKNISAPNREPSYMKKRRLRAAVGESKVYRLMQFSTDELKMLLMLIFLI